MEEWRDIPQHEGLYQVSNLGKVKSLDRYITIKNGGGKRRYRGKELKPQISAKGYKMVSLNKSGDQKSHYIHRLVYLAFRGSIPEDLVVNHIDENKTNNLLTNLELLTNRENICSEKAAKKRKSKYVGAYQKRGKWFSSIKIDGKSFHLGTFDTEEEAAAEYQRVLNEN